MTRRFALLFLLMLLPLLPGMASGKSPEVVSAEPAHRARDVDPATERIVVRFNAPIREGGLKFCGEPEFLPELTGEITYEDDFTAVLPVKLRPQATYRVQFHCEGNKRQYRVPGTEPERPVVFYFTTGSLPGQHERVSAKNLKAWKTFRDLYRTRYCYHDRIEMDWDAHFDEASDWILLSPTPAEFAQRLAILLEPAKDGHISVIVPSKRLGLMTDDTVFEYNGNFAAIERAFPDFTKHNENLWSGSVGEIGYIMVGSMMNTAYQLDPLERIMPQMIAEKKVLIVDVRTNGGGLDTNAKELASWFFDVPVKFAWMVERHEDRPGGWSAPNDQWLFGKPGDKVFRGKVIVLQGQMSASAAEWFALMMTFHGNKVAIGDRTMGCSASPVSQDLENGVYVNLPALMALKMDYTDFEGVGMEPDEYVTGDFSTGDPVLERALEIAREAVSAAATPSPAPTRRLQQWP